MIENIHQVVNESAAVARSIQIPELHTLPIRGILHGDVFSPHVTAHQAGDLAGFTEYDPLIHAGLRIDHRTSARTGTPMVRENEKTLLSRLWVITDMTGERYLQNPGLMPEFEAALRIGACGLLAADQQETPAGYIMTNGYDHAGRDPNGNATGEFIDDAERLAHQAATYAETRFATANQKHGRLFRRNNQPTEPAPKPQQKLTDILRTAAEYSEIHDSLVLVVSDFRDTVSLSGEEPAWLEPLAVLGGVNTGNNNTAIAVEVVNPEDFALGSKTTTVVDPVTGRTLATSALSAEGARYTEVMTRWTDEMRTAIGRQGIGHIAVSVSDPQMLTSFAEQVQRLVLQ